MFNDALTNKRDFFWNWRKNYGSIQDNVEEYEVKNSRKKTSIEGTKPEKFVHISLSNKNNDGSEKVNAKD